MGVCSTMWLVIYATHFFFLYNSLFLFHIQQSQPFWSFCEEGLQNWVLINIDHTNNKTDFNLSLCFGPNWMWVLIQTCKYREKERTCGHGITGVLTSSVLKVFLLTAGFVSIRFHPQIMTFEFWSLSWKCNRKLMRTLVCETEILFQ